FRSWTRTRPSSASGTARPPAGAGPHERPPCRDPSTASAVRSIPGCSRGGRHPGRSERSGLRADVGSEATRQPTGRHDVDLPAKQLRDLLEEAAQRQDGPAGLYVHEEVDVAVRSRVTAGPRPEHPYVVNPIAARDAEDVVTALAQLGHGHPATDATPPPAR